MSVLWRWDDDRWQAASPEQVSRELDSVAIIRQGNGLALQTNRPDVRINGCVVADGIQVLRHQDELLVGRRRLYYSTHALPRLVVLPPDQGRGKTCPLCRGRIAAGTSGVRCPGCGRWYHQTDGTDGQPPLLCWTYSTCCRFCQHPTDLDGSRLWRPDLETAR